jgi:hypothetical protein
MERRNITLSLPRDLLKRARHIAVDRGVSLSRLLAEHLEHLVREDQRYRRARRRLKKRLARGFDMGTGGEITWTRDELHER